MPAAAVHRPDGLSNSFRSSCVRCHPGFDVVKACSSLSEGQLPLMVQSRVAPEARTRSLYTDAVVTEFTEQMRWEEATTSRRRGRCTCRGSP